MKSGAYVKCAFIGNKCTDGVVIYMYDACYWILHAVMLLAFYAIIKM